MITEEDIKNETELVATISSTGSGSGAATARKILDRSKTQTSLAANCAELKPFLNPTFDRLEKAYAERKRVLLEGTQGSALSLHHGKYPYVTSRDTIVAGCLSEAGISPSRIRKVLMVVRTYPIRVANPSDLSLGSTSGYLKGEITFDEIARRSDLDAGELNDAELTSTTSRRRRVGEFDWELFRRGCALNAPTDLALTFVDYISARNRSAVRFDQLTTETMQFVEEMERVANAPVSLISTRFGQRGVIDRRDWS